MQVKSCRRELGKGRRMTDYQLRTETIIDIIEKIPLEKISLLMSD